MYALIIHSSERFQKFGPVEYLQAKNFDTLENMHEKTSVFSLGNRNKYSRNFALDRKALAF